MIGWVVQQQYITPRKPDIQQRTLVEVFSPCCMIKGSDSSHCVCLLLRRSNSQFQQEKFPRHEWELKPVFKGMIAYARAAKKWKNATTSDPFLHYLFLIWLQKKLHLTKLIRIGSWWNYLLLVLLKWHLQDLIIEIKKVWCSERFLDGHGELQENPRRRRRRPSPVSNEPQLQASWVMGVCAERWPIQSGLPTRWIWQSNPSPYASLSTADPYR